jgi:hypothetical protein
MKALPENLQEDVDVLNKLNEEINHHEINRDRKAKDFFKTHLHPDLVSCHI